MEKTDRQPSLGHIRRGSFPSYTGRVFVASLPHFIPVITFNEPESIPFCVPFVVVVASAVLSLRHALAPFSLCHRGNFCKSSAVPATVALGGVLQKFPLFLDH